MSQPRCWFLWILLAVPLTLRAEVGDPTIESDHPQYPGEGALQTVDDCVRHATRGQQTPQQRALALFEWILTHQYHLASPQEPLLPGLVPDTQKTRDALTVYDANRGRFSYGYGLCGTAHAWNEPYWRALGMRARRRAFPGHTNSEVFYEGGWHVFDTDMAGVIFRDDGVVAGYADMLRDPSLVDRGAQPPVPCYPFAWPGDFHVMKKGWHQMAEAGDPYALYNGGYAAHPGIVRLRAGEEFTRWFDPDHFGGIEKRRFWHHRPGGPRRNWTFVNQGAPEHDGSTSNSRGDAAYCNGVFDYAPPLGDAQYREGVVSSAGPLERSDRSPRLRSTGGQPVSVAFEHFSPYVICGDPIDDANPMSAEATDGWIVEGEAIGAVAVEWSVDGGQTWSGGQQVRGDFRLDLTEAAKGRYGWQVRFSWDGDAGLDRLRFVTTTQVAQPLYPRLAPDGCDVVYRAASRGVAAMLPNWSLPAERVEAFEAVELRRGNVTYGPRSDEQPVAYRVAGSQPGQVVFRVESPEPLVAVSAAARYSLRVPTPPEAEFRLDMSTDGGQSWKPMSQSDIPKDNTFSSGWIDGQMELSGASRSALVRVHLDGGGYPTGLIDAQFYGVYRAAGDPQEVAVTYGWYDSGELRTHIEQVPAGAKEHRFQVPTGGEVRDSFVRISPR